MKIGERYYHLCTKSFAARYERSVVNIEQAVSSCPFSFQPSAPKHIKSHFEESLNSLGWVCNVRVDSRIQASVNFVKLDVAFVLQLGNVARAYADILKLTLLAKKQITEIGILAVACNHEAKLLGANYANYERIIKELEVYSDILSYPLIVLGLIN